jgi:hypothetical protein
MQNPNPKSSGGEGVIFLVNAFSPSMLMCPTSNVLFEKIDVETAKRYLSGKTPVSYIGHDQTAKIMSLLLGIPVNMNRGMLKLTEGQLIIFTLNQRLPEGKILSTVEEIEQIGYSLYYVNVRCL